jgi:formylglycine-generating enzyme required for sulfatase activity
MMKKLALLLILLAPPIMAADESYCHPKSGNYYDCIAYLTQQIGVLKMENREQRANFKQQIKQLESENQAQLNKLEKIQVQLANLKKLAPTSLVADDPCNSEVGGTFMSCLMFILERLSRLEQENQAQQAEIQRLTADNQAQQAQIQRLTKADNKQAETADELSKRVTALDNKQAEIADKLCLPFANDKIDWTPGKVFDDCLKDGTKGPEMVVIPAGTFRMGDIQGGGSSNEQPVHEVSVKRFAMGRYEVTFAEYDKFAEATGRTKPDDKSWGRGNRPVINVSWNDVTAYAKWLSQQTGHHYRLPTEAEWEYSARAGTETKYWWGNNIGSNRANCSNCGDSFQYTAPVGSFKPNPFGLYETAGNVWEWTCSEYEGRYSGKEQRCAKSAGRFAARGASWYDRARRARSAFRNWDAPANRGGGRGVRLVRMQ